MTRPPSPVIGWCVDQKGTKRRHYLKSWGDWSTHASSMSYGRVCARCGKVWTFVHTTHSIRLVAADDQEAIEQAMLNKRANIRHIRNRKQSGRPKS